MKVDVFNMKGDKVETVELPAEIFEAPVNVDLIHQAYIQQMANARLGTSKTKTRSEVSGGGRKPWKQKGTSRARQGSTRAPQWVHGGIPDQRVQRLRHQAGLGFIEHKFIHHHHAGLSRLGG